MRNHLDRPSSVIHSVGSHFSFLWSTRYSRHASNRGPRLCDTSVNLPYPAPYLSTGIGNYFVPTKPQMPIIASRPPFSFTFTETTNLVDDAGVSPTRYYQYMTLQNYEVARRTKDSCSSTIGRDKAGCRWMNSGEEKGLALNRTAAPEMLPGRVAQDLR